MNEILDTTYRCVDRLAQMQEYVADTRVKCCLISVVGFATVLIGLICVFAWFASRE